MGAKRFRRPPRAGDRVRDKTNGRVGRVDQVSDDSRGDRYSVAYDEAPQDRYITTPVTEAVRRPEECLEPEK
jgi:hypothetical protein